MRKKILLLLLPAIIIPILILYLSLSNSDYQNRLREAREKSALQFCAELCAGVLVEEPGIVVFIESCDTIDYELPQVKNFCDNCKSNYLCEITAKDGSECALAC